MPILEDLRKIYRLWLSYYLILTKTHRYSLGIKVDNLFIEVIEALSIATYLRGEEKLRWLKLGIRKTEVIKVLLMVLWETGSIDDKKYTDISIMIEKFGRNLGGWKGKVEKQLEEQNSPKKGEK